MTHSYGVVVAETALAGSLELWREIYRLLHTKNQPASSGGIFYLATSDEHQHVIVDIAEKSGLGRETTL